MQRFAKSFFAETEQINAILLPLRKCLTLWFPVMLALNVGSRGVVENVPNAEFEAQNGALFAL